ncbi:PP2C family protein-serine/threonine phosphatase [Streptomyces tsukubensis]
MHQLSACPRCEESLDSGDLFCGACGFNLSSVPNPPDSEPTVALNGAASRQAEQSQGQGRAAAQGQASSVDWPTATGAQEQDPDAPVHRPDDLPGLDSGGGELPPRARFDALPRPDAPDRPGRPEQREALGHPEPGADDYRLPAPAAPAPPPPPLVPPMPSVPAPTGPVDPRATVTEPGSAEGALTVCVACRAGRVDADGYCENCGHAQPRERDHMERELNTVAAVTDRGLRHHRNEDAFAVSTTVLADGSPATVAIVCDGVSSATRPDAASLAAARAADASLLAALPRGVHPQQAMHEAILAAAEAVNALALEPNPSPERAHQNAPACTLVGAIVAAGLLTVGWVGDSRVYWVPVDRSTAATRLTEDDSWAAQMVAAGLMNEAEAYADERAHAITGWLGADAYELEPHTASFKPDHAGVVVVCTDGLWNYAEAAEEMAGVLPPDASERPLHSAQVLVGHALDGGGHDNVTVALVPFPQPSAGGGSA